MSSTEIQGWKEFFSIYPFTQEREDIRVALIAMTISNMSGKSLKKNIGIETFLPDYMKEKKVTTEKSLEEQRRDWKAFKEKYHKVRREAGLE